MKADMTPSKLACYCILMDHHRSGVEKAHPEYLMEKWEEMQNISDYGAFSLLDSSNQTRVLRWIKEWNYKSDIPEQLERQPSFTCPKCGMVSYHPMDVKNSYCGHCHLAFK